MNQRNLRICLFGTYFYNYARNTAIREGLKRLGIQVVEAHREVPKNRLDLPQDFTLWRIILRIWKNLKASWFLFFESQKVFTSDIVIVLYPGYMVLPLAWLLCLVFGKKLIFDSFLLLYEPLITERKIADPKSVKAKLLKIVQRFLLKLPDQVMVDTQLRKKFLITSLGISAHKIFVVPIGTNEDLYKPKATDPRRSGKIQVFFFGLYNPVQGTNYIIRAINLLRDQKNLTFTMLGDGLMKKEIVDYAQQNRLENVNFIGVEPESELVSHIQNCDIMLGIFSDLDIGRHSVANKIFAALACRKPLISARSPAMLESFEHQKHVFYCEPEDSESLAEAIKTLAHDRKLRETLAQNGYEIYREKFSWEKIGRSLLDGIGQKV